MLLARRGVTSTRTLNQMQRSVVCQASSTGRTRVAVVGDVHDQWSGKDAAALKALDVVSRYELSQRSAACSNSGCCCISTSRSVAAVAVLLLLLLPLVCLLQDFTLFVGDFGNERVSVVKDIASIDTPKAVILVRSGASHMLQHS
jgi:hypothetical protein